jgi:hypothetical protein
LLAATHRRLTGVRRRRRPRTRVRRAPRIACRTRWSCNAPRHRLGDDATMSNPRAGFRVQPTLRLGTRAPQLAGFPLRRVAGTVGDLRRPVSGILTVPRRAWRIERNR